MGRRVTLDDVARQARVSTALASQALNNRDGVAKETRARIWDTAQKLGYRADPHARALRTGASDSVALVVRNLVNPYFLEVISAAQQSEATEGVSVLVIDSDYSVEREREHIERLAAQRVGALAIAPVGPGASIEHWQELRPGRPTIVVNATARGFDDVTRVSPDNETAVREATTHLAGLGHRRISFLTAPSELMADHDRLDAFLEVCSELDIEPDPIETPLNIDSVQEIMTAQFELKTRPTAIVTNSDYTAHAIYLAARGAGLRIGQDVSLVGHDDLPTSRLLDPPLTTLRLDRRAIGRAVAARLQAATPLADHREPVSLVVRSSTSPAPAGG